MLSCHGEDVDCGKMCRFASCFDVQFSADAPNELGTVTVSWEHPAQKKDVPGLYRLHIRAERLGRRRQLNTKIFQALLGTDCANSIAGQRLRF
jgi:hypothetical protein